MGQPGTTRPAGQLSTAHKGLDQTRHGPQGPGKPLDRAASSSSAASTTSSAFSLPRSFPSSSYPSPSGVSQPRCPLGAPPLPHLPSSWPRRPHRLPRPLGCLHPCLDPSRPPPRPAPSRPHPRLRWRCQVAVGVPNRATLPLFRPLHSRSGLLRSIPSRRRGSVRGVSVWCMAEAMRCPSVERYAVVEISYGGFVAFRMAEMAEEAVEWVVILTVGISLTVRQRQELTGTEERDASEILLP